MSRAWAVCKKEFWGYFNSLIAYIFSIIFLGAVNILYVWFVLIPSQQVNLSPFFEFLLYGMWFIIPAITMRAWAEEKKLGTDELLLTLPVNDWEAVLGKYFAALFFFGLIVLLSLIIPISAALLGKPDWPVIICGYIGIMLVGGAYIAVGMMMSSLTSSQTIAFVSSVIVCLLLLGINDLLSKFGLPFGLGALAAYIDVGDHFASISRGVIDSRDIIYYLSLIAFFLVLNKYQLERRKWA
jgi:ABC-2 type transport system permease protein